MKRQNVRTLSLTVVTFTYLLLGAAIFDAFESTFEVEEENRLSRAATELRNKYNMSEDDFDKITQLGIQMKPYKAGTQWKFAGAFYFATTVITTIGYGHSTPKTPGGKMFCMCYAVPGIPLCLVMFQSIGERMNTIITWILKQLKKRLACKCCAVSQTNLMVVSFTTGFTVLNLGAAVFSRYEDWSYLDSFYYCFITLTTIGFGDFVALQRNDSLAKRPDYVAFSLIFILFGLTVVSSVMNLLVLRFLTMNTEDERRDQLEAAVHAQELQRLRGDVIWVDHKVPDYSEQSAYPVYTHEPFRKSDSREMDVYSDRVPLARNIQRLLSNISTLFSVQPRAENRMASKDTCISNRDDCFCPNRTDLQNSSSHMSKVYDPTSYRSILCDNEFSQHPALSLSRSFSLPEQSAGDNVPHYVSTSQFPEFTQCFQVHDNLTPLYHIPLYSCGTATYLTQAVNDYGTNGIAQPCYSPSLISRVSANNVHVPVDYDFIPPSASTELTHAYQICDSTHPPSICVPKQQTLHKCAHFPVKRVGNSVRCTHAPDHFQQTQGCDWLDSCCDNHSSGIGHNLPGSNCTHLSRQHNSHYLHSQQPGPFQMRACCSPSSGICREHPIIQKAPHVRKLRNPVGVNSAKTFGSYESLVDAQCEQSWCSVEEANLHGLWRSEGLVRKRASI
ncbi:hypothetical protein EG68_00373 [Paragonimus skrjabini miyazakii]|uniref:Potassium channel domain-containing protein n=1 Tax=Paragonimus skrjabini miyazakii TaxID=59628 RepID=A0A8S9ZCS0_9TREM|nr:hypothetical protein EG68_00373 [Paragonimus skrjabini miyazakii]